MNMKEMSTMMKKRKKDLETKRIKNNNYKFIYFYNAFVILIV